MRTRQNQLKKTFALMQVSFLLSVAATMSQLGLFVVGSSARNAPATRRFSAKALCEFSKDFRVAMAGGIAGGVGTALLYPIDTAKTLRQTDPTKYPKTKDALVDLFFSTSSRDEASRVLNGAQGGIAATMQQRSRVVLHFGEAYRGVASATFGSIPSSALYFGTYEIAKNRIGNFALGLARRKSILAQREQEHLGKTPLLQAPVSTSQLSTISRLCVHGLAAASGNTISSIIFVPKEYIKQQLQAYGSGRLASPSISTARSPAAAVRTSQGLRYPPVPLTAAQRAAYGIKQSPSTSQTLLNVSPPISTTIATTACTTAGCVIKETLQESGLRGLYRGYQATLLRNIPTAVLRFALYEEIKLLVLRRAGNSEDDNFNDGGGFSPLFFLSGAMAGAAASGVMTPFDVLKTRVATKAIPGHLGSIGGMKYIMGQNGFKGLYAGAQTRMIWSGVFSAIGFGTFEAAKSLMGVGGVFSSPAVTRAAKEEDERQSATKNMVDHPRTNR
jgi:hypothetical protein